MSPDNRHIDLTSVDREQLENFLLCLGRKNKISSKKSGSGRISLRVQFSDVTLYRFLLDIGLTKNKSRVMGALKVPKKYFFDFLRGHFDGDGSFYSYFDPRWKNSFMFYTSFSSASEAHIRWIQSEIYALLGISGSISKSIKNSAYQLKYAKADSLKLFPNLYYNKQVVCLSRKRHKIEAVLTNK